MTTQIISHVLLRGLSALLHKDISEIHNGPRVTQYHQTFLLFACDEVIILHTSYNKWEHFISDWMILFTPINKIIYLHVIYNDVQLTLKRCRIYNFQMHLSSLLSHIFIVNFNKSLLIRISINEGFFVCDIQSCVIIEQSVFPRASIFFLLKEGY